MYYENIIRGNDWKNIVIKTKNNNGENKESRIKRNKGNIFVLHCQVSSNNSKCCSLKTSYYIEIV